MAMPGLSAQALDTIALLPDGPSKHLLEKKKPIYAETCGAVPVGFSDALVVFGKPTLLQDVQDAYRAQIAKDHEPEFSIQQASSNAYYYVNKDKERTDITEVLRKKTSDSTYDIVYYSTGKRFFGKYEAVIHVRICANGEDKTSYLAVVYAYPENAFSRFFARHLKVVERYFTKKTGQMTEIVTAISCSLCSKAA